MGVIHTTLTGRYETMQRPVQLRLIQHVLQHLKLENYFNVQYVNDDGGVINPNALLGNQNQAFQFNTSSTNRVFASFEEEEREDDQGSNRIFTWGRPPVFLDSEYGLSVGVRHSEQHGTMTLQFRLGSRAKAEQFYTKLRRKLSLTNQYAVNAEYRVILPDEFWFVTDAMCSRIKGQFKPNLHLWQYVKDIAQVNLVKFADVKGKVSDAGWVETQNKFAFQYQTIAKPELVRDERGMFDVQISCSYTYQLLQELEIHYPEVIGLSPMPAELLETDPHNVYPVFYSRPDQAFAEFANITPERPFINYPSWDKFKPPTQKGVYPFYSVLCVPESDGKRLLNLGASFGDYRLSERAKTFLLTHKEKIKRPFSILLGISVYLGGDLINPERWELTDEGWVTLINDAQPKSTYHVVVTGGLDWWNLSVGVIDDYLKEGEVLKDILPIFLPGINVGGEIPNPDNPEDPDNPGHPTYPDLPTTLPLPDDYPLLPDGSLPKESFDDVVGKVNDRYKEVKMDNHICILTTGIFDLFFSRFD